MELFYTCVFYANNNFLFAIVFSISSLFFHNINGYASFFCNLDSII